MGYVVHPGAAIAAGPSRGRGLERPQRPLNNYYHDRGTGAKAIFRSIDRLLIFPDLGGISRKGRRVDSLSMGDDFLGLKILIIL
jgi:hypothetical protein